MKGWELVLAASLIVLALVLSGYRDTWDMLHAGGREVPEPELWRLSTP